jgi:hypothetical protein
MSKKLYYYWITALFGIILTPAVSMLFSEEPMTIPFINPIVFGLILLMSIFIFEAGFIETPTLRTIGQVLPAFFLVGTMFRISHYPWGMEIQLGAISLILLNLVIAALQEQNKGLIHYLLFLYISLRLLRFTGIVEPENIALWWSNLSLVTAITLVGIWYLVTYKEDE